MKIIIINHTFQQYQFTKRWKVLSQMHKDWDITLIAPSQFAWRNSNGTKVTDDMKMVGYDFEEENFRVKQVNIKDGNKLGITWTSKEMINYIDECQPDIVYHIGSHLQESLMQILDYKIRKNKTLKVFAFSMRGPVSDISNISTLRKEDKSVVKKILRYGQVLYFTHKLKKLNKYCDAIFCHYPDGLDCFCKEGYKGPIFMQTQVGVDTDVFFPDEDKRMKIRNKYSMGDSYVFASAVRFIEGKGIVQVLDALPVEGNWKYLLMGSGTEEEVNAIESKIKERGIEDKVILTGFIKWEDMSEYWNAVDCCVHFTQSTSKWVETFSLTLVQAMATKLPVVGSSSGSIPYQIGEDGIIVNEKNIEELHNQLQWVINNQDEAKVIGNKLYQRTINSFSISHLNDLFYLTVEDLRNNIYDSKKIDMTKWKKNKKEL